MPSRPWLHRPQLRLAVNHMRSFISVCALSTVLAACSAPTTPVPPPLPVADPTKPSIEEGRTAVAQKISRENDGVPVRLVQFEKSNGRLFDSPMGQMYELYFSATAQFPNGRHAECVGSYSVTTECGQYIYFGNVIQAGATKQYSSSVTLMKTEKGWILAG